MNAKRGCLLLIGLSLGLSVYAVPINAATIVVDSAADAAPAVNDGNCTLREAIEAANSNTAVDACSAGNGADTIEFAPAMLSGSMTSITLSDDLSNPANPVSESLSINGPGRALLSIDGNNLHMLFFLNSPGDNQTFYFNDMTLSSGLAAIDISGIRSGGALYIERGETVLINQVLFEQNKADNGGGAIYMRNSSGSLPITLSISRSVFNNNTTNGSRGGGAIRGGTSSSVSIEDSSFYKNTATHSNGYGGAIFMISSSSDRPAVLNISRTTLTKNAAGNDGGAIAILGFDASANIAHATIVGNIADSDENGTGSGGGISAPYNDALTLFNTIVANNQDRSPGNPKFEDVLTTGLTSNGFNLIGNKLGIDTPLIDAGTPNANNDYVGTDVAKIDPDLGPYGDNGGPSSTFVPLMDGTLAVIDKGSCAFEPHDQRLLGNNTSKKRAVDLSSAPNGTGSDGCDIGAVESAAVEIIPDSASCFPVRSSNGKTAVICI